MADTLWRTRSGAVLIVLLLGGFVLFACKGKEEKPAAGLPSGGVEERRGSPAGPGGTGTGALSPGGTAPGTSGVSPEVLADTPPRVTSLKVSPETPVVGDKVKVSVETLDNEGDAVAVEYYWYKNGQQLSESSDTLSLAGDFKRGDKITLTAVPDDGKRKGNPMSVNFFVANSLPKIQPSAETFRFDGRVYSYQVKATDPDGDALTYSLKSAPQGMTISSEGLIQWNVPPGFKGSVPVTVSITDGQGGETLQTFTVDIRAQPRRQPVTP